MAVRPLVLRANLPHISPTFFRHLKPSLESREATIKVLQSKFSRRIIGVIATMTSVLLAGEAIFTKEFANGIDFNMVGSDQTTEAAESGIRGHAQDLLEVVKALIESESWRELQKELRRSSPYLKQDIYTIIQNKPGSERPQLRKLYADLFVNVSRLDYAARDEDASRIQECYKNIVAAVDDILSRI
uniref:PQL-like protein n=1 Tax=Hypseocharis bilobata TaxID=253189 RepID=A0A0F7CYI3_9ROSI